jgi:uncharacterized protein (DUF1778 family)
MASPRDGAAANRYSGCVRFGVWLPLADVAAVAPPWPGVLQVRGDALLVLPRGKSAMILYAASAPTQSLSDFVRAAGSEMLARASTLGAQHVRFAASETPAADLQRLLDQFSERFGGPPAANS